MTDTDKLKRLAEAAGRIDEVVEAARDAARFMSACSPETILALIAENERLVEQYRTAMDRAEELGFAAEGLKQQRDEAVALLRDICGSADIYEDLPLRVAIDIDDFLARIDAVTKPVA